MKSHAHTIIAVACAVLVAASLLWALRTRSTARDIENRQAKLAAQNTSLKKRLTALTQQTNANTVEKTDTSQDSSTKRITQLEGIYPSFDKQLAKLRAEQAVRAKQLARSSSDQKVELASERANLGFIYAPFFRMAGLTPDQAAKLTEIMIQRDTTQSDISAVRQEHPDQKDDPVWQQLRNEATDEAKTAMQSLLGDDGLAQLAIYDRQKVAWSYVGNVAAGLALADLPVSFEQSQKLVEAMSNASVSFQNGKNVPYFLNDVDWSVVDAEAQKILTPEQFELFSTTDFVYGSPTGGSTSRWNLELQNAMKNALNPEAAK